MKVIVNKPKEDVQKQIVVEPAIPYTPKRTPFLKRLIRVCIEDIKSRLPHLKKPLQWDGKTIPKIEPKYK